ncbi:hypothetical protein KGP36_07180 [Patescibacteria group bacterium]|nr:hypothetical protein [Patescibacteria group bacterium]
MAVLAMTARRIPVQFGPSSDTSQATQGGGTVIENAYVDITVGGRSKYALTADPGLRAWAQVAPGKAGRGAYAFGNIVYAVFGEALYKVDVTGNSTQIGVVVGTAPVGFSQNNKQPNPQITICADSAVYVLENDVLTSIPRTVLPAGVHSTVHMNGYTLFGVSDGRVFSSDILSSTSINALNFDTAQRSPDPGTKLFIVGEDLWYFGASSLEVFRYIGGLGFPFQRLQGVTLGEGGGCIAKNSVVIVDNAPFWITDKKMVARASGYTPMRVSTSAVEADIDAAISAGISETIVGFSYALGGHQFYGLRCPLWCWVYDTMTQTWHSKKSYLDRTWLGVGYVYAFGKHLVLGNADGAIYEMASSFQTEGGQPLIVKLLSRNVNTSPKRLICDALYLDLQAGQGKADSIATEGVSPKVMLRVSRDGGETFGTVQRHSIGRQGNYGHQVVFRRLGAANGHGFVFEVSLSSPVVRAVFSATADVRECAA